jgi:hypothetical protein
MGISCSLLFPAPLLTISLSTSFRLDSLFLHAALPPQPYSPLEHVHRLARRPPFLPLLTVDACRGGREPNGDGEDGIEASAWLLARTRAGREARRDEEREDGPRDNILVCHGARQWNWELYRAVAGDQQGAGLNLGQAFVSTSRPTRRHA